jgi:diguanylate cyclase (GGDEF)-like protein
LAASVERAGDFAARYGGEEFLAALPNTGEAGARLVAGKMIENVKALNITHSMNPPTNAVTVSIGVMTGKVGFRQTWEEYVQRADEALYKSKEGGRNRYTFLAL